MVFSLLGAAGFGRANAADAQSADGTPAAGETPVDVATETPTPEATATATPAPTQTPATDNGNAAISTQATETATAVPVPALSYLPAAKPTCVAAPDGSPERIAAGGALEYDCSYKVGLKGQHLAPASIALDWTIAVSAGNGWTVQLLVPAIDPNQWSPVGQSKAHVSTQTGYKVDASTDVVDALDDSASIAFKVLVQRPACAAAPQPIELDLNAVASIPSDDSAAVTPSGPRPDPFLLNPDLAPIVENPPSVTIESFTIAPVTFSVTDQITHGELTIHVASPAVQCSDWDVSIVIQSFVNQETAGAATLEVIGALDDAPGAGFAAVPSPDSGKLTTDPVVVSVIQAGAGAGEYTQTLGFDLTIPGQTSAGAYESRATAAVDPVQP